MFPLRHGGQPVVADLRMAEADKDAAHHGAVPDRRVILRQRTPDTKSIRNLWSGSGATAVSSLRSRELPLSCFSGDLRLLYSPSAKRLTSYSAMS